MKALSFLETTLELINDPDTPKDEYMIEIIKRDAEHFSQPFKPELITELFEGWEVRKKRLHPDYLEYHQGKIKIIFHKDYSVHLVYFIQKELIEYELASPRTLDDFIRDCERAGIELTWRQK